jgi:hypothetical protein
MNVGSWPEIASYFYAAGVRFGHISAADSSNLRVCFLYIGDTETCSVGGRDRHTTDAR